jgi:hypothetical protein
LVSQSFSFSRRTEKVIIVFFGRDPPKKVGRAIRYNLFYIVKNDDIKKIVAAIPHAKPIVTTVTFRNVTVDFTLFSFLRIMRLRFYAIAKNHN